MQYQFLKKEVMNLKESIYSKAWKEEREGRYVVIGLQFHKQIIIQNLTFILPFLQH